MPTYRITYDETTRYETTVTADSLDAARDAFWNEDPPARTVEIVSTDLHAIDVLTEED